MATVADRLPQSQRAFAAGLAADRETQANKRSALVEVTGHYDWKGQAVAPCSRCGRVFVAASLRTVYGPGATALVCRRCKGERVG